MWIVIRMRFKKGLHKWKDSLRLILIRKNTAQKHNTAAEEKTPIACHRCQAPQIKGSIQNLKKRYHNHE